MLTEIGKKLKTIYREAEDILSKELPNLRVDIDNGGNLTCWVKDKRDGHSKEGINLKYDINVGQLLVHQERYLRELNDYVAPAYNEPDKYFYCTTCGRVLPKEEFADSVFAGYYCKDCAEKSEVAALIKESHKRGFYD